MMKRRREVELFADAMEKALREKDELWKYSVYSLFDILDEKIDKLMSAVSLGESEQILYKAADVANTAMMIADACGALESEDEEEC